MSEDFKPGRPTHTFSILDRETGYRTVVGAGWVSGGGRVSIKLNPGVVLDYEKCKNYALSLFPNDRGTSLEPERVEAAERALRKFEGQS